MNIKIPESAADELKTNEISEEKIILNPYFGTEIMTRREAIDCINHISGALLSDECYRSKEQHKKCIR